MAGLQIEYVEPDALKPFDGNPRKITPAGIEKLKRSIEEFGFANPILAQRGTGRVIAGHQRLKASIAAGLTEVPVVWLDIDDTTAKAYNIADNRLQQESEWEFSALAEMLSDLDTGAFDLTLTGFDQDEIEDLLTWAPDEGGEVVEDEVPEPPDDPVTKPGDLWVLGRHRLLCGDATSGDDLARLMGGRQADVVFTDPPYNVDYVGKTGDALKIKNDKMKADQFRSFLAAAFGGIFDVTKPGGAIYVCHADSEWEAFRGELVGAGWLLKQCLIWVKNSFVLGRQDYHWRHEPILYGWKPGAAHRWYGKRKQSTVINNAGWVSETRNEEGVTLSFSNGIESVVIRVPSYEVVYGGRGSDSTVWHIERPQRNAEHPTMKPVSIPARAIRNSTKEGQAVLDSFLGSGSTLVAAEQTGRVCCGLELDPAYCDVIIERWQNLTGGKAVREHGPTRTSA